MQKIVPSLWFDKNAEEAAEFYCSIFNNSKIGIIMRYGKSGSEVSGMPEGSVMTIEWGIEGYRFIGINGEPIFKLNPSMSFILNFDPSQRKDAEKELDRIWEKLSEGGQALMPLQEYPFSKRYGWIQDKFEVSWQLMLTNPGGEERPFIIPSLMFTQNIVGKCEEAINF
ncbi:VOC family protein, partial [Candidatus Pacearchaeota archaeon]|nr:VOC family protein [Candidatus Pacearchaeota archaeon]